jgi:TolB protein
MAHWVQAFLGSTAVRVRRVVFLVVAGLVSLFGATQGAWAQFRVEIGGVGATQVPVAIAAFRQPLGLTASVSDVIRSDLERSGLIRVIDSPVMRDETHSPVMADWRGRGADAVLLGSVNPMEDGRLDIRFKLWDVVKGSEWAANSLIVSPADLRQGAHKVADLVFKAVTGEEGMFSSRIAYISRENGRHTLWVADSDGLGAKPALVSVEPIISPAWSPDGTEVAYVSFELRKAVVFIQNVLTGQRRVLANLRGSNSAPAWSPDGKTLAITLSYEGGSQIYLVDRDGSNIRRLTRSLSIDTEAAFSADGQTVYFVSDRGGSPQIYRMPLAGGNAERVTFEGAYNVSPALSSDGRKMAYITRDNGNFRLMLMDLAPGEARIVGLTETQDDESPSFASNNRVIIYGTRQLGRGVVMTTSVDGKTKARLASKGGDVHEPAWGPLLK